MIEYLGVTATVLFVLAGAAQAFKSYRAGNSDGVSNLLLWQIMIGLVFVIIYVIGKIGFDLILLSSYVLQGVAWGVVMKYKYFPRRI